MRNEGLRIVAVREKYGDLEKFKLSDGRVITKEQACDMVEKGLLSGYSTGMSTLGENFIRCLPDHEESNNLTNLPRF